MELSNKGRFQAAFLHNIGVVFTDLTMRISRNKSSETPGFKITAKTLNKTRGYEIVADDDKISAQLVLKKDRAKDVHHFHDAMLTGEVEYGTNVHMHLLHGFPDRAPVTFSRTWVRTPDETKNKYEFAFATRKIKAGSGDTSSKTSFALCYIQGSARESSVEAYEFSDEVF